MISRDFYYQACGFAGKAQQVKERKA